MTLNDVPKIYRRWTFDEKSTYAQCPSNFFEYPSSFVILTVIITIIDGKPAGRKFELYQ